MGISLTPEERLAVFGTYDPEQHADEAASRWGQTDAYRQSRQRALAYTKEDWLTIKAEAGQLTDDFAAAQAAGEAPGSGPAMEVAERHREHISRWFYDCSPAAHRGLGELYTDDERFAANYESVAPDLAAYIGDAIAANAARSGRA
jgi:MerR family transcriptional regulator, thiopeptide resistance regulator